jgi:integrase
VPAEQQGRKGRINSGARRDHTVLLSTQAVAILRDLYKLTGHGVYVFPNRNDGTRVISENTILKVIEIIGYQGKMTGHGFRSLARTLLDEMGYRFEVLEAMLSHKHESQTVAAYARAQYIEERRVMMQRWADYLDSVEAGGEVIPFKRMAA